MLNKNSLIAGILNALIFPVMAFVTIYFLKDNLYLINKPALPYFIAIALNLGLVRVFHKKNLDQTVRGVMLSTFLFMVAILAFKFHTIK